MVGLAGSYHCSYRVCEFVYEERGEHEKIVECYLEDRLRQHQVFTYIRSVLSSQQFTDLHAQKIQQQFVTHIRVSEGNPPMFSRLFVDYVVLCCMKDVKNIHVLCRHMYCLL